MSDFHLCFLLSEALSWYHHSFISSSSLVLLEVGDLSKWGICLLNLPLIFEYFLDFLEAKAY
jgi:hypothetical protein